MILTTASMDTSWLGDAPAIQAPKLKNDRKRGESMRKVAGRKVKSWDCDGQYVFFRRKIANPAIVQRLMTQLAKGELKYIATSDDVEMYEVQTTSPFHRKEANNFGPMDLQTLQRFVIVSACKYKWDDFTDGLQELAGRMKNATYTDGKPAEEGFMRMLYQERLTHIFNMIRLRRGPAPEIVDREVAALRAKRGEHRSSTILLPS